MPVSLCNARASGSSFARRRRPSARPAVTSPAEAPPAYDGDLHERQWKALKARGCADEAAWPRGRAKNRRGAKPRQPLAPCGARFQTLTRAALQALREEVERREAETQVARLAVHTAERRLRQSAGLGSGGDLNYGYVRKQAGQYNEHPLEAEGEFDMPPTPQNALLLGLNNFRAELRALVGWIRKDESVTLEGIHTKRAKELKAQLGKLTLSNAAIWDREHARPAIQAPWIIKGPYFALCYMLDAVFDGRPLPRLWFLESVARMPYMSYVTMLHLYETLGWWRAGAAAKRVHFAQEWNEFHHLLVMESLGGDREWIDRFMAGHASIAYYWILCLLWILSPTLAYNFSELIEAHAVDTYGQFVDENEELLKSLPAPTIAIQYWTTDLYLFDELQTGPDAGPKRRPSINSLYDVFSTIRDDEAGHVATMAQCQDPAVLMRSPSIEAAVAATAVAATLAELLITNLPGSEDLVPALALLLEEASESAGV